MNTPTDWVSATAILAAGLILGLLFVFYAARRKAGRTLGTEPDLVLKDLRAKRDALIAQLRDPAIDADERTRLELETASVLRQLDGYEAASRAAGSGAAGSHPADSGAATGMNPAVKGFLWGATSVAALAALGYFVMQSAAPRQEGGSLTGDLPQTQQTAPADPVVQQLEAAVQRDPDNLQLRNDLAQAYLEQNNLMGVFEQTRIVLARSPDDSRALTFQGLVRMAMGEAEQATQMLQRATQSDPKNLDGWVALAWIYAQSNRMADAEQAIAAAAKESPNDKARLEQVFAQMKQQVAQGGAQPQVAEGELPPGHPPVDGGPAAAASGPSIKVTLDIDPAAAQKSGVLFVMARNPQGGPPVAVKRLQVASFPVTFDLSSADSMMGQPLPAKFRLEARLDSDGDAATKRSTDPVAMQNDVEPGAVVKLALK